MRCCFARRKYRRLGFARTPSATKKTCVVKKHPRVLSLRTEWEPNFNPPLEAPLEGRPAPPSPRCLAQAMARIAVASAISAAVVASAQKLAAARAAIFASLDAAFSLCEQRRTERIAAHLARWRRRASGPEAGLCGIFDELPRGSDPQFSLRPRDPIDEIVPAILCAADVRCEARVRPLVEALRPDLAQRRGMKFMTRNKAASVPSARVRMDAKPLFAVVRCLGDHVLAFVLQGKIMCGERIITDAGEWLEVAAIWSAEEGKLECRLNARARHVVIVRFCSVPSSKFSVLRSYRQEEYWPPFCDLHLPSLTTHEVVFVQGRAPRRARVRAVTPGNGLVWATLAESRRRREGAYTLSFRRPIVVAGRLPLCADDSVWKVVAVVEVVVSEG